MHTCTSDFWPPDSGTLSFRRLQPPSVRRFAAAAPEAEFSRLVGAQSLPRFENSVSGMS